MTNHERLRDLLEEALRTSHSIAYHRSSETVNVNTEKLTESIRSALLELRAVKWKCPRCGSSMVEREDKIYKTKFFGCSSYPKCRGNRDIDGRFLETSGPYAPAPSQQDRSFYRHGDTFDRPEAWDAPDGWGN